MRYELLEQTDAERLVQLEEEKKDAKPNSLRAVLCERQINEINNQRKKQGSTTVPQINPDVRKKLTQQQVDAALKMAREQPEQAQRLVREYQQRGRQSPRLNLSSTALITQMTQQRLQTSPATLIGPTVHGTSSTASGPAGLLKN